MANVNTVILIGNLTRDPEVKYSRAGKAMAQIGLAINRKWKDDGGTQHEETTFVDVDLFGRIAEIAGEYLKKGSSVYIQGRLKLDAWDDKASGQKRSKLKIMGENLQLLGSKGSSSASTSAPKDSSDCPY
jgi:single-strand DNA-binding protein